MPAQQLTERSKDRIVAHMGLPANSSTAALMKKVDDGGLDVEFKGGNATSGHVTTRQWITVGVLVYVNLINYMDRLTIAGRNTIIIVKMIQTTHWDYKCSFLWNTNLLK